MSNNHACDFWVYSDRLYGSILGDYSIVIVGLLYVERLHVVLPELWSARPEQQTVRYCDM